MKTVLVTGDIGSGKSAVCAWLSKRGVPVYDSDSRTKALYTPKLIREIEGAVCPGEVLTDGEGRLDKARLASIIFSSPEKLKALEDIVHPLVLEDFISWRDMISKVSWKGIGDVPFVVMESAIAAESPVFEGVADKVVRVQAPVETRLRRVMERSGLSLEEVEGRICSQATGKAAADAVIINDSNLVSLARRTAQVFLNIWK